MPGTSAERTRKYIENLKANAKYDDFKKKKAEREKLRRQRLKESVNKLSENKRKKFVENTRIKCLERVRKFRVKAKQQKSKEQLEKTSAAFIRLPNTAPKTNSKRIFAESSYRTDGAMAKATTKLRKTLPNSPSKRKAVIANFFDSLDDDLRQEIILNKTTKNKGGKSGISAELFEEITQFYEADHISRVSPNTKDVRFYRNPTTGVKQLKQKRYLLVTLQQAYDKFLIASAEKYPDKTPVKLSKFCVLRPAHVKLVNSTPQTVCLCIYHENFIQLCATLHKHLSQFPAYGPDLKRLLSCNDANKDCWFKTCTQCRPEIVEKKIRALMKGNGKKMVKWWQWEKDETTNRTEIKEKTGTVMKLVDYFVNVYQAFLKHSFTNRQQSECFSKERDYVHRCNDECLIQWDFAENMTNESQDEVTNAHWNQKQMSLFTISMRYWAYTTFQSHRI